VLRMTLMGGGGQMSTSPRSISPSLSKYLNSPTCAFQGVIQGVERMFFGTSDGWVMEEDIGTSFDGEAIDYVIRVPFNHLKSPGIDKAFHKLEFELIGASELTINYRQAFDYDDGMFGVGSDSIEFPGTGSVFDIGLFDEMVFDRGETYRAEASLDGQGRNMALLMWAESDFAEPMTLQGCLIYFTTLGVRP
jgi:hypothetical protein